MNYTLNPLTGNFDIVGEETAQSLAATIADLKALAPSDQPVILSAKNRGGIFVWDAASNQSPDDAIYIKSDLSATGNWVRQYSGLINAKWYGAVGDGFTNDTNALQAAIDAVNLRFQTGINSGNNVFPDLDNAQSPDCIIYVPSGVYLVSRTLQLGGGLRLIGDSQSYYPERWLGYASAGNTIQGTILQATEPFIGTCLVDFLPDSAHMQGITLDGSFLNIGSVVGATLIGKTSTGKSFGQKNGSLANNRIVVSDPLDPQQFRCEIATIALPHLEPGFAYEEYLEGWVGQYTGAAPALVWSITQGDLPPGLTLTSNGRISGVFAPVTAADYDTASFTIQLTAGANSATASFAIGILTAYCEDKKLLTGTVDRPYTYQLDLRATAPTGQTVTAIGAPFGMTISNAGLITYTPAIGDVGSYELSINVTDTASGQINVRQLGLEVVAQSPTLRIENIGATSRSWVAGVNRSHQIWAYGGEGDLTWSIDLTQTLPGFANEFPGFPKQNANGTYSPCPGLSLDPVTGILSGTPTSSGRATFYPRVADAQGAVWTEPCILEVKASSNSPKILSRSFPSARKGQPYSFQLNIENANIDAPLDFDFLPLPTGLTISPTGLISGTPTGGRFVDGANFQWSASIDNCNIRGFVGGVGIKSHGPANLHRVSRTMIHRCDIGISLKQCYDSHWEELYIYTNRIGIALNSGAAAHNFINCRIEYIYESGVRGGFANENAFTSCYWDTCGTQAIVADGCLNLNLVGNRFFRSGRLVPGTGQPDDPKADEKLSSHIYATKCSDLVISGNSFHVGSESEGDSSVDKTFDHYDDFARPRHCLNVFDCAGLVVTGNSLLGCVNESVVYGDGLAVSDKPPIIQNNQIVVNHILERRLPKKIEGNLLANGTYYADFPNQYSIFGAEVRNLVEHWTYESGPYLMLLETRRELDRSLPFVSYLNVNKSPDFEPASPNQIGILKNNSAKRFTQLTIGETILCSFYARARSGNVLPSLTVYAGTDENNYAADTFFGSRIFPGAAWKRYTVAFKIPSYPGLTIGKNDSPALEIKFLFDQTETLYDLDLSAHQLEIQADIGIPSPYKLYQIGEAVIPDLSADKITSGYLDPERIFWEAIPELGFSTPNRAKFSEVQIVNGDLIPDYRSTLSFPLASEIPGAVRGSTDGINEGRSLYISNGSQWAEFPQILDKAIFMPPEFAIGGGNHGVLNFGAIAIGEGARSAGYSVALGFDANAGAAGTCVGYATSGDGTTVGSFATAGTFGVAIGQQATNVNGSGIAIGYLSSAPQNGITIGRQITNNFMSTALGGNLTTAQDYETVFGVALGTASPQKLRGVGTTALNQARTMMEIDCTWVDSADATRRSRVGLRAVDANGRREGLAVIASGTGTQLQILGGTTLNRKLATTTSAFGGATIGGSSFITTTVTLTGATIGDIAVAGLASTGSNDNIFYKAVVTATNSITVFAYNPSTLSQTLPANTIIRILLEG